MDAAMEATAEFKNLVAAHQRLAQKYGDRRKWSQSNGGMAFDDFSTAQQHQTWREHAYPHMLAYPHINVDQYWRTPDSYDFGNVDNTRDNAFLSSQSRDAANVNHMISLQLASMEYARLLMSLNSAHPLAPFSGTQLQTDAFVTGLRTDNFPVPQGNTKRRSDEKDEQKTFPVKRARLVWTKDLHQKFVEAVDQIGMDKAVPKAILETMGIEGLTRENVASHLQKYRLQKGYPPFAKKMNSSVTQKLDASTTHGSNDGESDSMASVADNMSHSFTTGKESDRF